MMRISMTTVSCRSLALPVVLALTLSSCSSTGGNTGGHDTGTSLNALASFHPLQFVLHTVAGDGTDIGSVTPPGGDLKMVAVLGAWVL